MGLFQRRKAVSEAAQPKPEARQTHPREVFCRLCDEYRQFSKCWLRLGRIAQCPSCGEAFSDPAALYKQNQPACPSCGEFLEHTGFEYGLCDVCGSKYELVQGALPSLLPNRKQREDMNLTGQSWSPD
jgi:hypothetical protein